MTITEHIMKIMQLALLINPPEVEDVDRKLVEVEVYLEIIAREVGAL